MTWYDENNWFQKLPRPLMRWVALIASAWALTVGEWFNMPVPDTKAVIILTFAGGLYGIRGLESWKGKSNA